MREKIQHSNFSKGIAVFLIIPIMLVTSFSFPRPARADISMLLAAITVLTLGTSGLIFVVVDATTCWLNTFWGCSNTTNGVTTVIDIAPTASLTANPTTVDSGQSSTLAWGSTNSNSCTAAGGFNTGGATSGNVSTGMLTSTQNYQVTCTGAGGNATANASVTVLVPNIVITASPDRVSTGTGGATTISWNVSNVNSCTINKNGAVWKTFTTGASRSASGSAPDTINSQTTYTISCTNDAGSGVIAGSATKIVNIISAFQEF